MTRIDDLLPGQIQPGQEKQQGPKADGEAFGKALEQAMGQGEGPGQTSRLAEPMPTMPVQFSAVAPIQREAVAQAERTMDILEHYVKLLGDQSRSLKQVAPAKEALEGELKQIEGLLQRLDPQDELYGDLQNLASLVAKEGLRFDRGDYL